VVDKNKEIPTSVTGTLTTLIQSFKRFNNPLIFEGRYYKRKQIPVNFMVFQIAVSLGEDKLLKKLHHVARAQGDSTVATEAACRIMARKTRSSSSESGSKSVGKIRALAIKAKLYEMGFSIPTFTCLFP